ncbi:DUF1617 family protein [Alkalicoccobacillus gibsonii]|uniref:DUF1617 family protein n=1 Tax=Alkalicoccobacillus gibsonii TaxID=79881 RepID=UPI003F7BC0D6
MIVSIENQKVAPVINFLKGLPLKGKQSRHRTRFIKLLNNRLEGLIEEEKTILEDHSHKDEDDNVKFKEGGKYYDIKDPEALKKDKQEFYKELYVIDRADYEEVLQTVQRVLDGCEVELSGEEADIFDYLCEQFDL